MTKSRDSNRWGLKVDPESLPLVVFVDTEEADDGEDNPFFLRRDVPPDEPDAGDDD